MARENPWTQTVSHEVCFAREIITHRSPCRFLIYIQFASLDTIFYQERGWCIIFLGAFVFITVIPSNCAALRVCLAVSVLLC